MNASVSPGRNFDARLSAVGAVAVLGVRGDADGLTAPRLAEMITIGLAERPAAMIVDLSRLDFLAASGMTVLLEGQHGAGSATRFGVVAAGTSTSRPMKLMGLDLILNLYPTLDAALEDHLVDPRLHADSP